MKSQLYFWSSSDVIERRYYCGLHKLINLYMPLCDNWIIIDNEDPVQNIIAKGSEPDKMQVINNDIWETILRQSKL